VKCSKFALNKNKHSACMPMQVTKQYRALNTAISVTCSCRISFVDELTWDAEAGCWLLVWWSFFHLENVFKLTYICCMAWVLKQQQNFATHLVLDMINAAFLAALFFFLWTASATKHNNTIITRVYSEMLSNKLLLVIIDQPTNKIKSNWVGL